MMHRIYSLPRYVSNRIIDSVFGKENVNKIFNNPAVIWRYIKRLCSVFKMLLMWPNIQIEWCRKGFLLIYLNLWTDFFSSRLTTCKLSWPRKRIANTIVAPSWKPALNHSENITWRSKFVDQMEKRNTFVN